MQEDKGDVLFDLKVDEDESESDELDELKDIPQIVEEPKPIIHSVSTPAASHSQTLKEIQAAKYGIPKLDTVNLKKVQPEKIEEEKEEVVQKEIDGGQTSMKEKEAAVKVEAKGDLKGENKEEDEMVDIEFVSPSAQLQQPLQLKIKKTLTIGEVKDLIE